jgi:site-specific DNA-adenine methylase
MGVLMVYPGSKSRLAPIFIPMLNKLIESKNITSYIEPFVGGAISLMV